MMNSKCGPQKVSEYSPFGQVKFPLNLPNDPKRKCKGHCGEEPINNNIPVNKGVIRKTTLQKNGNKKNKAANALLKTLSSLESGLSFLKTNVDGQDETENRSISYKDVPGSSFGAHLLQKSAPMTSDALDKKLKFKRDSNVGNLILQSQQKIPQPLFINEIDSEEIIRLRKDSEDIQHSSCRAPTYPIKRNMVHNQFLTTNNRAKEGLKYVMATNFPRVPPDTPIGSPPIKSDIEDECGRKSHHPKLRARDLGKRLCEAPSMTEELDELYKDYIEKCPEGNEKSEACRFLHHAPSPHHREPRRSILKDHHTSQEFQQHRKSSGRGHLVRFDKEVGLIDTANIKVSGIDASLRSTDDRLKHLKQIGGRITAIGAQESNKSQEKYPLNIRDPRRKAAETDLTEWMKQNPEEELEERTAKQDLARIYFTTEATRVMACANLGVLERNTNLYKKTSMSNKQTFPHFFMDRLEKEQEIENKRMKEDRLASIKNEMDAFDESLKHRPVAVLNPKFDPSQPFSEKSLNDLKLKVEIMKRQKERDVQSAAARNRTRKAYFSQMLPSFSDVIKDDLMDYSIKRASKLSGEEMILAGELLVIAKQQDVLEEHRRKYEIEEEELMSMAAEEEEEAGENEKMIKDILEICVDVVVKICNYKTIMGKDPPESLRREWRDAGFSLMSQQDVYTDLRDHVEEIACYDEGSLDEETSSQTRRQSELSNETQDETKEASVSARDDGDDNRQRCIVAISSLKEPVNEGASVEGEPATSVHVHVTDCLHEDIESALTYDGVYLPLSETQLTPSSSETQSRSSASPSVTSTDSHAESINPCENIQQLDNTLQQLDRLHYNEYEGEDGEYYDINGEAILPVDATTLGIGTSSNIRMEVELTEETVTEGDDGTRVGEVEVQAIDYSEGDSPEGGKPKGKGLHFDDPMDKKSVAARESTSKGALSKADSKNSLKDKDNIKFALPEDFLSKRSPVLRKPTAFHPKQLFDDDMDDDDDLSNDVLGGGDEKSELVHSLSGEEEEEVEVEEDEFHESDEEERDASIDVKHDFKRRNQPPCTGPSKRKILVYEELQNISYGMNWKEHEKKFLEQRCKELKEFSATWVKGLSKPPSVFTIREKSLVPCRNPLSGKRMPPFNILDPHIPKPKFNLRIKHLMQTVEKGKVEQNKCNEDEPHSNIQVKEPSKTTAEKSVQETCLEVLKSKTNSKKRPSWQDEIAEYECQRKEREKLIAKEEVVENSAKILGFDAFDEDYELRRTFFLHNKQEAHKYEISLAEHNDDQDSTAQRRSVSRRKSSYFPAADAAFPENDIEDEKVTSLFVEEESARIVCDDDGADNCESLTGKYMEIPGEGIYDDNLEFSHHKYEAEQELLSIQDVYNE